MMVCFGDTTHGRGVAEMITIFRYSSKVDLMKSRNYPENTSEIGIVIPARLRAETPHFGVYRKECQQKNGYPLQKVVAFVS